MAWPDFSTYTVLEVKEYLVKNFPNAADRNPERIVKEAVNLALDLIAANDTLMCNVFAKNAIMNAGYTGRYSDNTWGFFPFSVPWGYALNLIPPGSIIGFYRTGGQRMLSHVMISLGQGVAIGTNNASVFGVASGVMPQIIDLNTNAYAIGRIFTSVGGTFEICVATANDLPH